MAVSIHLPATQRAIVANDGLDYSIREDVSLPPLSPDSVIIRTSYVGLNPVDTKMVGPFVGAGATYGVSSSIRSLSSSTTADILAHLGRLRRRNSSSRRRGLRFQAARTW